MPDTAQPPASRNLVLFHVEGLQDLSDFETIRMRIMARHPEVKPLIYSIKLSPEDLLEVENCDDGVRPLAVRIDAEKPYWKSLAEKPTLLFCAVPLDLRSSLRGLRLFGQHVSKAVEMRLLWEKGFPIPRTAMLGPGVVLGEAEWGPLVVVKPAGGRGGRQVRLVSRQEAMRMAARTRADAPRMLVQQWIDTGPRISSFRVMTVLDRVVYILRTTVTVPLLIDAALVGRNGVNIASNGQRRSWEVVHDGDVWQLAQDICRALTFTPTFGIDILRDQRTGALHVVELNSGFPTWHLSSRFGQNLAAKSAVFRTDDLYDQYGALDGISDALAEAALTRAV